MAGAYDCFIADLVLIPCPRKSGALYYLVGDAKQARKAIEAIHEVYEIGLDI